MIALTGTLTGFFLVVYLLSQQKRLGTAMLIGAAVIGLTSTGDFVNDLRQILPTFFRGVIDPMTIQLVVLVTLVTIFAYMLKEMSLLKDLINVVTYYLSSIFLSLIAIPSLIGVLPIPGGAIFSAPMIEPLGEKMKLNGAELTSLNIFFRHLWYFAFPYMPSLILASSLSGINVLTIAAMHLPIVGIMIVIGWVYYSRAGIGKKAAAANETGNADNDKDIVRKEKPGIKKTIKALLPYIIVLVPPILMGIDFVISLVIGVVAVAIIGREQFSLAMIKNGFNMNLTYGIFGVMIFRAFIDNSHGVENLTSLFLEAGFHPLLLALVVPFIVGLLTGNHVGAIGISYPVVLGIFSGGEAYNLWHMVVFSSSYFGYLISPFHMCNIMTVKYYNTSLGQYYRDVAMPLGSSAAGIFLLGVLYWMWL